MRQRPILNARDWCAWAQTQDDLILTIDDFAAMPLHEQVAIVPLELTPTLMIEDASRYFWNPLDFTVVASAAIFFTPLCRWFSRSTDLIASGDGTLLQVTGESFESIYCTNLVTRHAETGSGRYYTRYMMWEDLVTRPGLPLVRLIGESVLDADDR